MDLFRSIVAPVVKENPVFTDFLLSVLYPVCSTSHRNLFFWPFPICPGDGRRGSLVYRF